MPFLIRKNSKSSCNPMTDRDIYNLTLNAKCARDFCEMCTDIGQVRIGDLIRFCAPRIEHRDERYRQLKQYSETKPIVSFSDLSRFINISRQTLYNWKDEGWIITDHNGKADLRRTVELWEECSWNA